MLLVLAATVVSASSFQSLVVFGRKECSLCCSALYRTDLMCVSSSLSGWSWKELEAVDCIAWCPMALWSMLSLATFLRCCRKATGLSGCVLILIGHEMSGSSLDNIQHSIVSMLRWVYWSHTVQTYSSIRTFQSVHL